MSYIIPADRVSLAQQERLREQAVRMAIKRLARKLAIPEAQALDRRSPAVIVRDADYPNDFIPVATRGGLAGWLSQPLAAVAGWYDLFADNAAAAITPQAPNNQAWVFYGVDILLNDAAVESVSQLRFSVGTAANRRAQFDLEGLYGAQTVSGYLSQPVFYDPQEIATVEILARVATTAGARVRLATFIAEPIQVSVI